MDQNTIAAVSTGRGGAISVIRMSGKEAAPIADRVFESLSGTPVVRQKPFTVQYGRIREDGHTVDEVLLAYFKAPRSYTGEDVVEISCHGSSYVERKVLSLLIGAGARAAAPGEFTLRAYLNGKMDLVQAEAVADLIASASRSGHRIALNQMRGGYSAEFENLRERLLEFASLLELELDFSEEDVEFADRKRLRALIGEIGGRMDGLLRSFRYGNALKNGVPVAIAGPPNAGKSTLLNALLREEKALVSDIAGTTRDVIEDTVDLGGILFRFIDTAGIRETSDRLESLGIERTFDRVRKAEIVLWVADVTEAAASVLEQAAGLGLRAEQRLYIVLNKSDRCVPEELRKRVAEAASAGFSVVAASAREGTGLAELETRLSEDYAALTEGRENEVLLSNARHYELLGRAGEAVARVASGLESGLPADLLAQDVREIIAFLGELTGRTLTSEDVLGNIFSKFCIGK